MTNSHCNFPILSFVGVRQHSNQGLLLEPATQCDSGDEEGVITSGSDFPQRLAAQGEPRLNLTKAETLRPQSIK